MFSKDHKFARWIRVRSSSGRLIFGGVGAQGRLPQGAVSIQRHFERNTRMIQATGYSSAHLVRSGLSSGDRADRDLWGLYAGVLDTCGHIGVWDVQDAEPL